MDLLKLSQSTIPFGLLNDGDVEVEHLSKDGAPDQTAEEIASEINAAGRAVVDRSGATDEGCFNPEALRAVRSHGF